MTAGLLTLQHRGFRGLTRSATTSPSKSPVPIHKTLNLPKGDIKLLCVYIKNADPSYSKDLNMSATFKKLNMWIDNLKTQSTYLT